MSDHSQGRANDARPARLKTFRRAPSAEEQARREQWGKTWGGMISRAAKAARDKEQ